jgi:hypothetical protein
VLREVPGTVLVFDQALETLLHVLPLTVEDDPAELEAWDHRLLLVQLDGPLLHCQLGVAAAFAGRDRLALNAQLLLLDRDGPVLLLGDDPLADAGLAPRHLLGIDLQLLLGAGQGLPTGCFCRWLAASAPVAASGTG